MRNTIKYSFVAAAFAVFAIVSVESVSAQGILGDILKRMDAHNQSLRSLKASVTMEKHNPQLDVTDVYVGSTSYLLPSPKGKRYMRLDWAKPTVEQISIIGDEYELYKPSINQVYFGRVNQAKTSAGAGNALAFMSMSREQLRANYDIKFVDQENIKGGVPTWRLNLTPKNAANFKFAEIWVDGNGMPVQAKVHEQNNDTTKVLLENIDKNKTIPADIFRLSYNKKTVKRIAA